MIRSPRKNITLLAASLLAILAIPAFAQELTAVDQAFVWPKPVPKPAPKPAPKAPTGVYYPWMDPDIQVAWNNKFYGQGTTITFIDDFSSSDKFSGQFGSTVQTQRHGDWTSLESSLIAPQATIKKKDFGTTNTAVTLATKGLNVLNLSYGMYAANGYTSVRWGQQESSIISDAKNGKAVVVKAAGNDAIPVGGVNSSGNKDYLDTALIGAQSAIFAGALDHVGSTGDPAGMAFYSNTAGTDVNVQNHFLVVGVDGSKNGDLLGTSFAAPIISGYAAIVGSKFTTSTPTQITNKLLSTARTNTLLNYDPTIYGKGEACLACALAPLSIH